MPKSAAVSISTTPRHQCHATPITAPLSHPPRTLAAPTTHLCRTRHRTLALPYPQVISRQSGRSTWGDK